MAFKIKTTEETATFIKNGSKVQSGETSYYYIPYWFKSTEDPLVFEMLSFEKLPKELTDLILKERQEKKTRK